MDSCKELLEKYTQEYKIDSQIKQKAEELYKEYITAKQNSSQVRF